MRPTGALVSHRLVGLPEQGSGYPLRPRATRDCSATTYFHCVGFIIESKKARWVA